MRKGIYRLLCFSFAWLIGTTTFAQIEVKPETSHKNEDSNAVSDPAPLMADEEIFKIVEDMPRFPGCEEQGLDKRALQKCAQKYLMTYMKENLVYPEEAKKRGIEGTCVAQFTIAKDGSMENIKMVRDIDPGVCKESCGAAALKMLEKMQSEVKWIAGKQRGKTVKVQYTLPIPFKL